MDQNEQRESERLLIEQALQGDNFALEALFDRYREPLRSLYEQRIAGEAEDVDDLLQETFIKVYLKLHRYDPHYAFGQWIHTIARNTFIDHVRRKREKTLPINHLTEVSSQQVAQQNLTPEESLILTQNHRRLDRLIESMPTHYQTLIRLRFFSEYSYAEIATKLELPMGTVKTQIHRARERLCRLIVSDQESIL